MASDGEERVTAAVLIIGDEILSGRTQDTNLRDIARYLGVIGVDLAEARTVPDVMDEIVDALNALRARYDYVITTGGIGPTHDDITADAVAKAFGVALPINAEARALLEERWKANGTEVNEARLRMARIPEGGTLIINSVSAAPGFKVGNVHVMAGVPKIMQAMLESIAPTLEGGARVKSVTIRCLVGEGSIGTAFGHIQEEFPDVKMGSYPRMGATSAMTELVLRSPDEGRLTLAAERVKAMVAAAHKHAGFAEAVEAY